MLFFVGDLFLKCLFYLISSKCESCENLYYIYLSVILSKSIAKKF